VGTLRTVLAGVQSRVCMTELRVCGKVWGMGPGEGKVREGMGTVRRVGLKIKMMD